MSFLSRFSWTPLTVTPKGFLIIPFPGLTIFLSTFGPAFLLHIAALIVWYKDGPLLPTCWLIVVAYPVAGMCWLIVRRKKREVERLQEEEKATREEEGEEVGLLGMEEMAETGLV